MARIATKPLELVAQLNQSALAILAEPNWPAAAPTNVVIGASAFSIQSLVNTVTSAEAALTNARALLRDAIGLGREQMGEVDSATDLLYGPEGPQKANYGLAPKQTGGGAGGATPTSPVITSIGDGVGAGAIFVDWSTLMGSSYEIEWHTNSAMTARVGNQTVTKSELVTL